MNEVSYSSCIPLVPFKTIAQILVALLPNITYGPTRPHTQLLDRNRKVIQKPRYYLKGHKDKILPSSHWTWWPTHPLKRHTSWRSTSSSETQQLFTNPPSHRRKLMVTKIWVKGKVGGLSYHIYLMVLFLEWLVVHNS